MLKGTRRHVDSGWDRFRGQVTTLGLVALVISVPQARAATFTVNSTASTPDAVPGDGVCDDGTGACTLGAAVGEAASVPTCQEPVAIHFSVSGQIDAGIEYHFAADSPCTNPSLSIIGPGADSLTLSGGVSASGALETSSQVNPFLGLQGLHVSGELHVDDATFSLTDVVADDPIVTTLVWLSITDSSVSSIEQEGMQISHPSGNITVVDSTTGRIASWDTLYVSLVRTRVSGGLSTRSRHPGWSVSASLEDSLIEESPEWGVFVAGDVHLARTTIRNNRGGGIAAYRGFVAWRNSIEDCTISGNGGVGVHAGYGSPIPIVRSTIVSNQGGGVSTSAPGASISISDSIVANNTVGGEPLDCSCDFDNPITAIRSLIGVPADCSSISADGNLIGVDPMLGPLAENGGLTPTHALLAGSPAIDAAGACTGTDQRGVVRPQGTACDMGAFEFACGNATVDLGEQCDDGTPGDGDCCSTDCRFEATGTACADDHEPCTADVCDEGGVCTHGFPLTAVCHEPLPRGATLAINDSVTDRSDKVAWKWKGLTDLADFGNPSADSDFTLCVADAAGNLKLSAAMPAAGICAGKNCWRSTKAGYSYADTELSPNGIRSSNLRASATGTGTIKIKGKGDDLSPGELPLNLPATVRLVRSDSPVCWESRFTTATRNQVGAVRAKAD